MIQLREFLGKRGEIDGIRQHLFAGLPCGALASLRPGPPLGPLLLRLSDLPPGDRGHLLLLFEKGKVKSFIQSEDGAERTLNLYQQGSIFGEASFFDELPRVSSAVALTPCEIVPIDREQVTAEFTRNPGMAMSMLKYLARTVRLLSAHVDDMAFRPAEWRVAQYLLSAASGQDQVSCTQEEIASSISVSRVTVSRILNQFSRRGLVALGYRSISLLDRRTLETLCTP